MKIKAIFASVFCIALGAFFPAVSQAQMSSATISSISPTTAKAGDSISVYGSNFDTGTFIAFDGSNGMTIYPATRSNSLLTFVVPSALSPGAHEVRIGFKGSDLPLSNPAVLTVAAPIRPAVITSIGPASVKAGDTVWVYGYNFDSGAFIALDGANGQTILPVLRTDAMLGFVVPANTSIGTHTIQVGAKASDESISNSVPLTVTPTPRAATISSISPTTAKAGDSISVYGSNFDTGTFIAFDGSNGMTIYPATRSNSLLTFVVPSALSPGAHEVRIGFKGSDLPLSNPAVLTVATFSQPVLPPTTSSEDIDTQPISSCASLSNNLRYRSRDAQTNGDVSLLQDFLQDKGYLNSEPTGFFGMATLQAVKKFQSENSINPTGFVGAATRAKIKDISCR